MCEYIYRISLEKDGSKATGKLTRIYYQKTKKFPFFKTTEEKFSFDPFYILGDLRNQLNPYKIHMKRSDYFKKESNIFSSYDCEYGFNLLDKPRINDISILSLYFFSPNFHI